MVHSAITPRVDHPVAVVALVLVVLVALAGALFAWRARRRGESAVAEAWSWRADPAEPWGTMLLGAFLVTPAAVVGTRAIHIGWLAPILVIGYVAMVWRGSGGIDQVRGVDVDGDGVEVRGLFGRHFRVHLGDVIEVKNDEGSAVIRCRDGFWVRLPDDDRALRVARNLAGLIGRPWPEAEESPRGDDGE